MRKFGKLLIICLLVTPLLISIIVSTAAGASDEEKNWHVAKNGHSAKVNDETAHTWDSGFVTKEPTLHSEGEKKYTCTVCQKTKTEVLEKLLFNWYEVPVDAWKGTPATSSSTYILFGVFPATKKSSNVTIDETDSVTMGAYNYYKGSDGMYYAKKCPYHGDSPCFHSDSDSEKSRITFWKVEPIKWRVLTTDYNGTKKALLLATNTLIRKRFWDADDVVRRLDGLDTRIFPNDYKYSQIRAYLNGLDYYDDNGSKYTVRNTCYTDKGFLQTAFTTEAQKLIETTNVDNSIKSSQDSVKEDFHPVYWCDNTDDKIFLLSRREVTTLAYGFSGRMERIKFPTDFADTEPFRSPEKGCTWLLRSTGIGSNWYSVQYVSGSGVILDNVSTSSIVGIVPALTISLE